jgi:hypothetical protein
MPSLTRKVLEVAIAIEIHLLPVRVRVVRMSIYGMSVYCVEKVHLPTSGGSR